MRLVIPQDAIPTTVRPQTLAESEREHIVKTLEACKWRIKGPQAAAERLGMKPSTLYTRMRKLAIPIRAEKFKASTAA